MSASAGKDLTGRCLPFVVQYKIIDKYPIAPPRPTRPPPPKKNATKQQQKRIKTKKTKTKQRPASRDDLRPAPGQYTIPSTMGTTADSRFKTVVAPGFGTPPPAGRPHSATGRLGTGPGPGAYDVVSDVDVVVEVDADVNVDIDVGFDVDVDVDVEIDVDVDVVIEVCVTVLACKQPAVCQEKLATSCAQLSTSYNARHLQYFVFVLC